MNGKYQTFYPGKYLDWEKDVVDKRLTLAKGDALKGGTPDSANEYELLKFNHNWDPYNPLFNDRKYAQSSGYRDVPAWPSFKRPSAGNTMSLTIPENLGDLYYIANDGTKMEFFTPIYPGDTFTSEAEKVSFEDVTTPGSDLRIFRMSSITKMYNQRGELVIRSSGDLRNAYRKIIDGSQKPSYNDVATEWVKYFPPAHRTTDAEWEYIKKLWDKEYIRGKNTLYWEDVKVGDEPTWTCSGPITYMDMMGWYGGNHRPIRDMLAKNPQALDRDQYGQYIPLEAMHYGSRNIPGFRMIFYNDTGTKHITRMVTNYIGDAGFVTKISWIKTWIYKEMLLPRPGGEWLDKVPYMKGKACNRHGSEGDTVIAKGYVTGKYINERGENIIDLSCWGETMDGDIVQAVEASAKLPARRK